MKPAGSILIFDYLSVEGLQDSTLAVAVGDVVGHGVEAAMLIATEALAEDN